MNCATRRRIAHEAPGFNGDAIHPKENRMKMNPVPAAVALALAVAALAGCNRETQADARNAARKVDAAVTDAAARAGSALERAGEKAEGLAASIEKSADEAAITASIKASLVKDPELSALRIDVDTRGTVVTLNGTAPTRQAAERAGKIAIATQGVTEVRNNLVAGG
jgi:osmotically-inducible protein OsmY